MGPFVFTDKGKEWRESWVAKCAADFPCEHNNDVNFNLSESRSQREKESKMSKPKLVRGKHLVKKHKLETLQPDVLQMSGPLSIHSGEI